MCRVFFDLEGRMKFETIKTLKTEAFRRLTGVKRETFDNMAFIL